MKTIAIDMDGTLLNKDQIVSKENKAAIEQAQREGVEVIVATGRSYEEARYALDQADLRLPIICINGAVVMTENGEVAASNPMNIEDVRKAASILEEKGVYFEIYTNKGKFTNDFDQSVAVLVDIFLTANPSLDPLKVTEAARERFELGDVVILDDYEVLFNDPQYEIYKFLAFSNDLSKLGEAGGALKRMEGLAVSSSGRENLEITSKNAQKGLALEKYLAQKDELLSEAMAIGDNYNDVSMFELVGRSVAMGNAPLEIQKMCSHVTAGNDEAGVAKAIQEALNIASVEGQQ